MSVVATRRLYQDIMPYVQRPSLYVPARRTVPKTVVSGATHSIDGIVSAPKPVKTQVPQAPKPSSYAAKYYFDAKPAPPEQTTSAQAQAQPVANPVAANTEETAEQAVRPKRGKLLRALPVTAAVLVLVAGLGIFALTLRTNQQIVAQVSAGAGAAEEEESAPGEEEVSSAAVRNYSVSPDMPRTLTIDNIDVFSRVKRLGLLSSGTLATPGNIYDTGWYEGSSKPGDGGAVLLVGHVHGPTKPGVFKNLHKLEAGSVATVTRGDGQKFDYKVIKKQQVPTDQVDMAAALVPVTPGKAGLNIITCAGELIPGTTKYADRIVVYLEQIN